jgi:hypothetical protein
VYNSIRFKTRELHVGPPVEVRDVLDGVMVVARLVAANHMAKPWETVATEAEFRTLMAAPGASLWLCGGADATADVATAIDAVFEATATCAALQRVRWDLATAPAFAAAMSLKREPTVLAVARGELLDKIEGPDDCGETVAQFAEKFGAYAQSIGSSAPVQTAADAALGAGVPRATSTPIDVAKMVTQGQDLLAKGQALYAEKFFAKALGVLDALEDEADDNINGSCAETAGWLVLARIAQGSVAPCAPVVKRLRERHAYFVQPDSTAARAVALYSMAEVAPFTWRAAEASQKVLGEQLKADPKNAGARQRLVMTLFMAGDVERCLTEGVKLHVLHDEFGSVAVRAVVTFLGPEHALSKRVGNI